MRGEAVLSGGLRRWLEDVAVDGVAEYGRPLCSDEPNRGFCELLYEPG